MGRGSAVSYDESAHLLAEARQKLEELREVSEQVLSVARAAVGSGRTLRREDTRAFARASSLARYVADCVQRAAWEPPLRRKRKSFTYGAWSNLPSSDHERQAAEILRKLHLPKDGLVLGISQDWRRAAVAWLELDQKHREPETEREHDRAEARERGRGET
jgi:hypothetical protein